MILNSFNINQCVVKPGYSIVLRTKEEAEKRNTKRQCDDAVMTRPSCMSLQAFTRKWSDGWTFNTLVVALLSVQLFAIAWKLKTNFKLSSC
jgi:hypothetical protein